MLKNRDKELSSQYYTNYGFDLTKKYQRTYEILFGKNMKFLGKNRGVIDRIDRRVVD